MLLLAIFVAVYECIRTRKTRASTLSSIHISCPQTQIVYLFVFKACMLDWMRSRVLLHANEVYSQHSDKQQNYIIELRNLVAYVFICANNIAIIFVYAYTYFCSLVKKKFIVDACCYEPLFLP